MMSVASRPLLSGPDLDRAIDRARTELTALPGSWSPRPLQLAAAFI